MGGGVRVPGGKQCVDLLKDVEQSVADWETLVDELVNQRAQTHPARVAVHCGSETLGYGELIRRSERLAARLAEAGVRRGDRVAILIPPAVDAIVAVLGVLRAGATYVPLATDNPDQRLAWYLRDAEVKAAVVTRRTAPLIYDGDPADGDQEAGFGALLVVDDPVPTGVSASVTQAVRPDADRLDDPAYLVYTSGSSGPPKGVVVEHRQLAASTAARREVYPGPGVFLLVSPLAFDSSVAGVWGTLTAGGTLVVAETEDLQDPSRLVDLIQLHGVTRLLCIPSLYAVVLDAIQRNGQSVRSLETVVVAGESLPEQLMHRHFGLFGDRVELVNEYGPTEATVWASYRRYRGPGAVSIGRAVPGVRLHVVDERLEPVAHGEAGELVIGGPGVARGYHRRPDETAAAFLADPWGRQGARVYLTGDIVRRTDEDTLEFLGRRDRQVKIRGQRVGLEAVEAELGAVAGVLEAVVVPDATRTALTAFVRLESGVDPEAVRDVLAERLPAVMVPSRFRPVDTVPRTSNGKVDRARLAETAEAPAPIGGSALAGADSGTVEALVVAAWCAVLRVRTVPSDVNFFDVGGNSLALFRLQDALENYTGSRPEIVDLFRYTTVSSQAALLSGGASTGVAERREQRSAARRARAMARRERLQPRKDHPAASRRGLVRRVPPQQHAQAHIAASLTCPRPVRAPRARLVCFPHAGGSPSLFGSWGERCRGVEVHGVCYPGRAHRIAEPVATDLVRLAREIAGDVATLQDPDDDTPIALFGHSLGAVVALETARALQERSVPVAHLFASGSRDAPLPEPGPESPPEEDAQAVAARLIALGGTDAEMARDPMFQELILPYVQGDSAMFHSYSQEPGPLLHCPVTSIVGDTDANADERPWHTLTDGQFREHVVNGDHFYLIPEPPLRLLENALSTPTADRR